MILKTSLGVVTAAVALAGHVMYSPIPDGIEAPARVRFFTALFNIRRFASSVREKMGYGTFAQDIRFWQSRLTRDSLASRDDTQVSVERIAGVDVVIYRHTSLGPKAPAIVYFHGGGMVLMSAYDFDQHCYEYSKRSGTVLFSVNYRKAPDHIVPAGNQDCLNVTRHVLQHAELYDIDANRVGVAGDSAGGAQAASVSYALTQEKSDLPRLKYQVLHVPALQIFNFRTPSYLDDGTPIIRAKEAMMYFSLYLGIDPNEVDQAVESLCENRHIPPELRQSRYADYVSSRNLPAEYQKPKIVPADVSEGHDVKLYQKIQHVILDPQCFPLMADDLRGLPPAFIQAGEMDVVRDDALLYAKRLRDAGVKVHVHMTKGGTHIDYLLGLFSFLSSKGIEDTMEETFNFIKRQNEI